MYYVFRLSYSTPIMVDDDADVTNKTDEFEKVNKYTKITIYCWLIFILIISNFRIFHIVPIIQLLNNHNLQLSQHHHQLQQESLISRLTHFLGYPDSTFLEGLGLGLGKRSKGSKWVSTRERAFRLYPQDHAHIPTPDQYIKKWSQFWCPQKF